MPWLNAQEIWHSTGIYDATLKRKTADCVCKTMCGVIWLPMIEYKGGTENTICDRKIASRAVKGLIYTCIIVINIQVKLQGRLLVLFIAF